MPRKAKATTELNEAPCKAQRLSPSNQERITAFLADAAEYPTEAFGAEVRIMLQQGFDVGCTAEVEHQYVLDTEQMVEDVVRDAQKFARKAFAESEEKSQKLELEIQTLKESRQSLVESASSAHAVVAAQTDTYHVKQTKVSQAEADKTVTACTLASSVTGQELILEEKKSLTEAIEGSLDVLLAGTADADGCKSKHHIKTVVQMMKKFGAEASLVASLPSVLSVAPADRTQWHSITIDAMKKLVADVVAELDKQVAAAALEFTASEAEDMGAEAIVDHFNAQVLEARVALDMAERAAEKADADLLEMDQRLDGLATDADKLKSEQTLLKGKVDEMDAVFSSLEYVRSRYQRLAAEKAEREAQAEAAAAAEEAERKAQEAMAAEVPMTAPAEIEAPVSDDAACDEESLVKSSTDGKEEMVGVVSDAPQDSAVTSKLDVEPAVLCRTALGA